MPNAVRRQWPVRVRTAASKWRAISLLLWATFPTRRGSEPSNDWNEMCSQDTLDELADKLVKPNFLSGCAQIHAWQSKGLSISAGYSIGTTICKDHKAHVHVRKNWKSVDVFMTALRFALPLFCVMDLPGGESLNLDVLHCYRLGLEKAMKYL